MEAEPARHGCLKGSGQEHARGANAANPGDLREGGAGKYIFGEVIFLVDTPREIESEAAAVYFLVCGVCVDLCDGVVGV